MVSKTQVATGDRGVYEKAEDKVWLYGHVNLSDGGNVTKGDSMIYDLQTGHAIIDPGGTASRVSGLFISGSDGGPELGGETKPKGDKGEGGSQPAPPNTAASSSTAPPVKAKTAAPAAAPAAAQILAPESNAPFNLRP